MCPQLDYFSVLMYLECSVPRVAHLGRHVVETSPFSLCKEGYPKRNFAEPNDKHICGYVRQKQHDLIMRVIHFFSAEITFLGQKRAVGAGGL